MRIISYNVNEIFEKKLYLLIPFYIFNHEKKLKSYENDEKKLKKLEEEYKDIVRR